MLEKIYAMLQSVAVYVEKGLDYLQPIVQKYIFGVPAELYAAYVLLGVLLVGFLIRGIFRSFGKNPRTTIFFVILFAVIAAAWFAVYKLV